MDFVEVFNRFRKEYDSMSFDELKSFYNFLYSYFPMQRHFNFDRVLMFFNFCSSSLRKLIVFELGGWDGELACKMIAMIPEIVRWDNYEICDNALKYSNHKDSKYYPIDLNKPVQEYEFEEEYNVGIFSHVLEHMKYHEIEKLFNKLNLQYVYIDCPFSPDWNNYYGTHILEKKPDEILINRGYTKFFIDGDISFWKK